MGCQTRNEERTKREGLGIYQKRKQMRTPKDQEFEFKRGYIDDKWKQNQEIKGKIAMGKGGEGKKGEAMTWQDVKQSKRQSQSQLELNSF